ncbi:MAG: hypothetical protein N3I35_15930 [Clostridia bacterium]|nr:hypothetical protein [Clostridia bacterium]
MKALKTDWRKVICIICISGFINMVFHAVLSPINTSNLSSIKLSIFVKNGMLIPAVIVWELLAFSVLALVFILIQDNLPGKRWIKGLMYGLSFGGLYFIGMFEAVLLFNTSVQSELLMGLTDCATLVLSGTLLGIFTGTDSVQKYKLKNAPAIFVISFFYVIGRYLAYTVFHIQSANDVNPLGSFIWTLSLGLWVGNIYLILQSGAKGTSIIRQSVYFGVIVFGLNWLMNHIFMYVVLEFTFDLLIRVVVDILFTVVGVIAFKKLSA